MSNDRSKECKCECHTGGAMHVMECSCYRGKPVLDTSLGLKRDIKYLNLQIKDLNEKSNQLNNEAFDLSDKRNSLVSKLVLQNELLKDSNWELEFNGDDNVNLFFISSSNEKGIDSLKEHCRTGWHSRFELEEDISIHFDDSSMSIYFGDSKLIEPFVKLYQLKLEGELLESKIHDLEETTANLKLIYKKFIEDKS